MTTIVREAFFRCVPFGAHFFVTDGGEHMSKNIPKKVIDITGTELTPGDLAARESNTQGFKRYIFGHTAPNFS